MNMHDANTMIKYLKSRKTQPYKTVSMCNDTAWGYGVRIHDTRTREMMECYSCNRETLKRLLEEIRTDYNLFGFDRRTGRFFYAN